MTGRQTPEHLRILLYSHDTFGLGHLRRTNTLAHALTSALPNASALILSGSPVISSFDMGSRVDFVRIPGVIKRQSGAYEATRPGEALRDTIALRTAILHRATQCFAPDLVIVDKEPSGLHRELIPALETARAAGATIVLGVRDVLDAPDRVAADWDRRGSAETLERLYDHIWVYGLASIYRPLQGVALGPAFADLSPAVMTYTGYLRRATPGTAIPSSVRQDHPAADGPPFLLVTAGGGGDGEPLIDWVLSAYEHHADLPWPAHIVMGPFMASLVRERLIRRVNRLARASAVTFDPALDQVLARSTAVAAMGGYNTFCEVLTHDRPALFVPRTRPRLEQKIRTHRAQALGLASALDDPYGDALEGSHPPDRDPDTMAQALRHLAVQSRPSAHAPHGLLDGLDRVVTWVARRFALDPAPCLKRLHRSPER